DWEAKQAKLADARTVEDNPTKQKKKAATCASTSGVIPNSNKGKEDSAPITKTIMSYEVIDTNDDYLITEPPEHGSH
ncbi:unnamed protein product, partial [Allacma fusca]